MGVRRVPRDAPRSSSLDGAELLDVGGVKAGPGPEVGEAEELDRVVPAIEALRGAFRRAVVGRHVARRPCSTRRARGRGRRQRHLRVRRSRLPDRRGQALRRPSSRRTSACAPACRIPNRTTTISSPTCAPSSSTGRARAEAVGLTPEQIVLDAGLDLGKTPAQSAVLLRESGVHAAARIPVPAVGLEQAVHRRAPRSTESTTGAPSRSRPSPTASGAAAGSCACTTSSDPRRVCRMLEALLAAPPQSARVSDARCWCRAPTRACATARSSALVDELLAGEDRSLALEDTRRSRRARRARGRRRRDAERRRRRHIAGAAGRSPRSSTRCRARRS